MELSSEQRQILLGVARQTIRTALGAEAAVPPTGCDDPVLHQPAGCFVTLHSLANHRLRGCVGRLDTRDELIVAVRLVAGNVLEDPRFASCPVRLDELPELEIEITIIFPLRPAANCLDFDLVNDGIYLILADRAGCFLPQVARETAWDRQQLLARLCTEKMGLPCDAWRNESARLMKFHTLIVGPEPFDRSVEALPDFRNNPE